MLSAFLLSLFLPAVTPATAQTMIITEGHIDLNIGYDISTGEWGLYSQYRAPDDSYATDTPVGEVTYKISEAGRFDGMGGFYSWLGSPGSDIWVIPQNQISGVPWVGFGGYGYGGVEGGLTDDFSLFDPIPSIHPTLPAVLVSFVGIEGPEGADFALWQTNATGGLVGGAPVFSSVAGTGAPDSLVITRGQHTHYNWGFSEEGIYTVLLQLGATIDGVLTQSDIFTVTFHVGNVVPEPASWAAIAGALLLSGTMIGRLQASLWMRIRETIRSLS
ncbi:actinobacterial surface-anchored protein domain protein [Opitutaceae bacterium TAV1]|nr:actinobacterial surface-anchored protein domain protein [Opitutaceae bacterium TAV1]